MNKKIFNKKALIIVAASIILIIAIILSINFSQARLIGSGYGKGVIYTTEQNFSSSVLRSADSLDETLHNVARCESNSQPIAIMNYDPSNFAFDEFDLRYVFCCYLNSINEDDNYTYAVKLPNSEELIDISSTTKDEPYIYSGKLKGGVRSTENFEIVFIPKSQDLDPSVLPSSSVCVTSHPTAPEFMSHVFLGATVSKTLENFNAIGSFKDKAHPVGDLMGFIYNVITYGATNDSEKVRITWDGDVLQLDSTSKFYPMLKTDEDGKTYIEYSPKLEGEENSITFFRTDAWGSGYKTDEEGEFLTDENGDKIPYEWNESTIWEDIEAIISITTEIGVG